MIIVTDKHRERLIELLVWYLGSSIHDNETKAYYKSIIANIKRQDRFGEYWVEEFIGNTK